MWDSQKHCPSRIRPRCASSRGPRSLESLEPWTPSRHWSMMEACSDLRPGRRERQPRAPRTPGSPATAPAGGCTPPGETVCVCDNRVSSPQMSEHPRPCQTSLSVPDELSSDNCTLRFCYCFLLSRSPDLKNKFDFLNHKHTHTPTHKEKNARETQIHTYIRT